MRKKKGNGWRKLRLADEREDDGWAMGGWVDGRSVDGRVIGGWDGGQWMGGRSVGGRVGGRPGVTSQLVGTEYEWKGGDVCVMEPWLKTKKRK